MDMLLPFHWARNSVPGGVSYSVISFRRCLSPPRSRLYGIPISCCSGCIQLVLPFPSSLLFALFVLPALYHLRYLRRSCAEVISSSPFIFGVVSLFSFDIVASLVFFSTFFYPHPLRGASIPITPIGFRFPLVDVQIIRHVSFVFSVFFLFYFSRRYFSVFIFSS